MRTVLFALIGFAVGCGSSTEETAVVPPDPPLIQIESIQTPGGAVWAPGEPCVEAGSDEGRSLSVQVGPTSEASLAQLATWTLSPPETCADNVACGSLWLEIRPPGGGEPSRTPLLRVPSAVATIPLQLRNLPLPAAYRLSVELRDDDGHPLPDSSAAVVEIEFRPFGECSDRAGVGGTPGGG